MYKSIVLSICAVCLVRGSLAKDVCQNIEVTGAAFHSTTNNIYSLHGEIHCNSRPVWEDAAGKHYVYYLLDGYDGWMIGPTSCYYWGNFMVSVRSEAETPYEVTEVWREFSPEEANWKEEADLKVQCFSDSGNVTTTVPTSVAASTLSPEQRVCESQMCSPGGDCVRDVDGEFYCKCKESHSGSRCLEQTDSRITTWTSTGIIIGLSVVFALCILGFLIFIFKTRTAARENSQSPVYTSYKQLENYFKAPAAPEDGLDATAFKYKPLEDDDVVIVK